MNLLRRVAPTQLSPLLRLQYQHGLGARSRLLLPSAGRAFQKSAFVPQAKPLVAPGSAQPTPKDTFEPLGIYTPLAANLKLRKAIERPTQLQRAFIPPILEGKDVLIRDTTGSGKTFGILLSLLNKPRRVSPTLSNHDKGSSKKRSKTPLSETGTVGITSVVLVPNQELALQLLSWTRDLFPGFSEQDIDRMLQVVVTPSLSLPDEDYTPMERRSMAKAVANEAILESNRQVEKLTQALPHVLVATPARLWDLLERGILDLSGIETLVLDEVDHLIRLPKRFASHRQIYNRALHPKPSELAVREVIRSAKAVGRYSGNETDQPNEPRDRIQIIAASATMNRPIRYWLEENEWVQNPEWVDTTKSVVLPEGIHHHCVVISSDSIRNMRLEAERDGEHQGTFAAAAEDPKTESLLGGSSSGEPVDWAAVDQEWKDKDAEWKERQLSESGPGTGSETMTVVEKFKDDDDRMLEGVATACMLDKVQNACVFFCSSPSLNDVATRLEQEFGLETKMISNAFGSSPSTVTSEVVAAPTTSSSRRGIFLAHESNARGLDLPKLSHVYIVGLPSSPSSYLHMAGRTGRMGERGQVVTILRDDGHIEDRARSLFKRLNVQIQPFTHVQ